MPTVIATSMPKKTPVPMPWRLADPGPLAKTSGIHAEHEGQRGHDDGPEAQARACTDCP